MRYRCVCCALPKRLLEHVDRKAGTQHAAAHAHTEALRAQRHEASAKGTRPPAGGQRHRMLHDARGRTQPLPGELVRGEAGAPVRDAVVNDAYDNLGITLDFYSQVFGRNSLDNAGMDVIASVHYGEAYGNAMWDGKQIVFGDGDIHIGGFARALDIVAHELTHAVTQYSIHGGLGATHRGGRIDLVGEAGSLNESISDVFASLVKQWHKKQKAEEADWLIGDEVIEPNLGRAVRSLKHPGKTSDTYPDDDQVPDMRGYLAGGDVHRNSGIPSHAFYLTATQLRGHAWEHAGRIWYESIALLKKDSGFRDAAQATVKTAAHLFGVSSKEQHAVQAAWEKVGVLHG